VPALAETQRRGTPDIASTLATSEEREVDEAGRAGACSTMLREATALTPMPMPCERLP